MFLRFFLTFLFYFVLVLKLIKVFFRDSDWNKNGKNLLWISLEGLWLWFDSWIQMRFQTCALLISIFGLIKSSSALTICAIFLSSQPFRWSVSYALILFVIIFYGLVIFGIHNQQATLLLPTQITLVSFNQFSKQWKFELFEI